MVLAAVIVDLAVYGQEAVVTIVHRLILAAAGVHLGAAPEVPVVSGQEEAAVQNLLLILLAQLVPIIIVFGAIKAIMALLELAVPGTQEVVLTGVTMDLGI